jgi:hypothetical protein
MHIAPTEINVDIFERYRVIRFLFDIRQGVLVRYRIKIILYIIMKGAKNILCFSTTQSLPFNISNIIILRYRLMLIIGKINKYYFLYVHIVTEWK